MSLYRITTDRLELIERTTFAAASVFERKDLQRLLRRDISVIAEDLMVIAEEPRISGRCVIFFHGREEGKTESLKNSNCNRM